MATTSTLYATTATQTAGTWTSPASATGAPDATGTTAPTNSATWVNATRSATATLELSGYNFSAQVASGSTVNSVTASIPHAETSTTNISALTAQLYSGATAIGAAQAVTRVTSLTTASVSFTGTNAPTSAQLADLRLRIVSTRANNTTSSTQYIDGCGLAVNYTVPPTPTVADSVSAIGGLAARFRADQITGLATGGAVTTWPDASGFAFDATQPDPVLKPTWQGGVLNGQPVVRWTGVEWMNFGADPGTSAQTIIVVGLLTNITGNRTLRAGLADRSLQFRVNTSGVLEFVAQNIAGIGTSTSTVSTGLFHELVGTYDATTGAYNFFLDNTAAGSGTNVQALAVGTTSRIGDQVFTPNEPFVGDIAEVIVFSKVLSAAERATVDSYVTGRYGAMGVAASAPTTVTGVTATVSSAAPAGTTSAAARITGVAATASSSAPGGAPSAAARITGVAATASSSAPAGTASMPTTVIGVAATASSSAPGGAPSAAARITGVAATASSSGLAGNPTLPLMATLIDDFGTADTTKWVFDPNATVIGGQVRLTTSATYGGIGSVGRYSLVGSSLSVQVLQTAGVGGGSIDTSLTLVLDASNSVLFTVEGGLLYAQAQVNGSYITVTQAAYSAATHAWWRLSESAGVVTWATSPDGVAWMTYGTWTSTLSLKALQATITTGYWGTEASPGTAIFDKVNIAGTVPATIAGVTAATSGAAPAGAASAGARLAAATAVASSSATAGQPSGAAAIPGVTASMTGSAVGGQLVVPAALTGVTAMTSVTATGGSVRVVVADWLPGATWTSTMAWGADGQTVIGVTATATAASAGGATSAAARVVAVAAAVSGAAPTGASSAAVRIPGVTALAMTLAPAGSAQGQTGAIPALVPGVTALGSASAAGGALVAGNRIPGATASASAAATVGTARGATAVTGVAGRLSATAGTGATSGSAVVAGDTALVTAVPSLGQLAAAARLQGLAALVGTSASGGTLLVAQTHVSYDYVIAILDSDGVSTVELAGDGVGVAVLDPSTEGTVALDPFAAGTAVLADNGVSIIALVGGTDGTVILDSDGVSTATVLTP